MDGKEENENVKDVEGKLPLPFQAIKPKGEFFQPFFPLFLPVNPFLHHLPNLAEQRKSPKQRGRGVRRTESPWTMWAR